MLCFAPLLLAGYAVTVQTDWHRTTEVNAPIFEAQTCEEGLGAHLTYSAAGLYGLGLHYGFTHHEDNWTFTLSPHAGLSYADHPIKEIPLRKQFELGLQALVGYQRLRIGVEYWHLSNAGLKSPNIGLDMVILQTGWSF